RRAASRFANFFIFTQPLSLNPQTFRAIRHRLSATFCRFTSHTRAFADDVGDRKLLIQLAGLASRRLLPLVDLLFVISHLESLKPADPNPSRFVRPPPPLSSISAVPWTQRDRGRSASLHTKRRQPLSRFQMQFARLLGILQPQNSR